MKNFLVISILLALFAINPLLQAQDKQGEYLGLPGDNLNLYAVMRLFQNSKTLEEFERNLNDPKSNINNLDLNGDNLVDYIKVFDDVDGDVHNIVLQVAVTPRENQDVAVFTVQRFSNGQVQIQLTGDEELYGKNYIVEPIFDDGTYAETINPGYTGNDQTVNNITYVRTTPVEIAAWPVVRFIFLPSYTVWHSSWYWGYYPAYWHPWQPFSWHYYYGYHYNWYDDYYSHYRRWDNHRYARWDDYYYHGRRSYSPEVNHRIEVGTYKASYSHPEQRKEGEEMFAKTHPEQYKRLSANSSDNAISRRSDSHPNDKGLTNGNSVSNSRRSSSSVSTRTVSDPAVMHNSTATKTTTTTGTNRFSGNKISDKNNVNERRTSTTTVNRSVTNHNSDQNKNMDRKSVQQKSTTASSPNKRSINKYKKETTNKKENKSKDSDNKDPDRRK
jgi:hypothetical protein